MACSTEKGLFLQSFCSLCWQKLTLFTVWFKKIETSWKRHLKVVGQVFRHGCYWKRSGSDSCVPQGMEINPKNPCLALLPSNSFCGSRFLSHLEVEKNLASVRYLPRFFVHPSPLPTFFHWGAQCSAVLKSSYPGVRSDLSTLPRTGLGLCTGHFELANSVSLFQTSAPK